MYIFAIYIAWQTAMWTTRRTLIKSPNTVLYKANVIVASDEDNVLESLVRCTHENSILNYSTQCTYLKCE